MVKDLFNEISKEWETNSKEFNEKTCEWAERIKKAIPTIKSAKQSFYKSKPLRFYTSVGKLSTPNNVLLSVRFLGQEVAELQVVSPDVKLKIKPTHKEKNKKSFKLDMVGTYDWKSKEAKAFRAYFKDYISINSEIKPHSPEHRVESVFLEEMEKKVKKNKFDGFFYGIKPITIEGFPLQMPLPISASSGRPVKGNGHIDTLARRRCKDGKVRLSVWEIKKPKALDKAVAEVYIYAVSIAYLLNSECGYLWCKLFGFKKLPEIEAVIAITEDQGPKTIKEIAKLMESNQDKVQNISIKFSVAYYDAQTSKIKSLEEL